MTENDEVIYKELNKFCKYQRYRKFSYAQYIENRAAGAIVSSNKYHKGFTQEEFYAEVASTFKNEPCSYCYNCCTMGEYMEISNVPMCDKIVEEWMTAYKIGGKTGNEATENIKNHYIYQKGWVDYVSDDEIINYYRQFFYRNELKTYFNFQGSKPDLRVVVDILKKAVKERKTFVVRIVSSPSTEAKNCFVGIE